MFLYFVNKRFYLLNYELFCEILKECDLPPSEQKVANYLKENFSAIPYCKLEDICTETSVAKATMSRFMKHIGFYGFSYFKRAVVKELEIHTQSKPFTQIGQYKEQNSKTISAQHFSEALANLDTLKKTFDSKAFAKIINTITNTKGTIYVIGTASSFGLAYYFHSLLKYFELKLVFLHASGTDLAKDLIDIKENDLLFVISFYRYNQLVVDTAQYFHKNNAKVIVITNNAVNPFAICSDIEIILPSYSSGPFQSRLVAFSYLELIIKAIAVNVGDEERFAKLEKLFTDFKVFV